MAGGGKLHVLLYSQLFRRQNNNSCYETTARKYANCFMASSFSFFYIDPLVCFQPPWREREREREREGGGEDTHTSLLTCHFNE